MSKLVLCAGVDESVSTFGLWNIKPNFYNAVPTSVRVDIDIRDSDKDRRDRIITQTLEGAEKIAKRRKCGYSGGVQWEYPIATSNKEVRASPTLGNCTTLCQGRISLPLQEPTMLSL